MPTEETKEKSYDVAERSGITWRQISKASVNIAKEREQWAGFPVPLPDFPLVLEEKYPHRFDSFYKEEPGEEEKIFNHWFSDRLGADVCVIERDGKRSAGFISGNKVTKIINTIGASLAWPLEAESMAIMKLCEMIHNHAFLTYMLTGTFLETSKRSGVSYIFRKLRPTIALRPDKEGKQMRVLCTLCLHPVGYYSGTWAGTMTPTDDVIAHLTMMRGDEPKFWANANQHQPERPESGI